MTIYNLALPERIVQFLVDQLRRLPHAEVDAELQSIRTQCEAQDRTAAERVRAQVRAEIEAERSSTTNTEGNDDALPELD